MDLTVIALMRNAERAVDTTLARLRRELTRLEVEWELVLVDEGSRDQTVGRVERHTRGDERLRLIRLPHGRGPGHALRQGFRIARGELIVTMDFDPEYSPDQIALLLGALRAEPGHDFALGSCHHPDGRMEGYPRYRRRMKHLRNMLLRLVLRNRIHTSSCIFRGYRRAALEQLELTADGEEIHLEILSQAFARGYSVTESPAVERFLGVPAKRRGWRQAFRYLRFTLAERPALLYGCLGFLVLVVGAFGVSSASLAMLLRSATPNSLQLSTFGCLGLLGVQILVVSMLVDQQRAVEIVRRHRIARHRRRRAHGSAVHD